MDFGICEGSWSQGMTVHMMEYYSALKRKETLPYVCYNMDETCQHYTERYKLVTKRQILCDHNDMRFLE
jgi:hypothetical protein